MIFNGGMIVWINGILFHLFLDDYTHTDKIKLNDEYIIIQADACTSDGAGAVLFDLTKRLI